jgi:outer membrane protein assembly factor BamB
VSTPQIVETNSAVIPTAVISKYRGRWKWCVGILVIACLAQASLWAMWWEDPTHFKMSILFVWPAALFALTNWWLFFSGWSWRVRLGSLVAVAAILLSFFKMYRLEFDGDMVPRRIVLRSTPTAEEIARKFFKNQSSESSDQAAQNDVSATTEESRLVSIDGDWTGFRGPNRNGVVQGSSLRRDWSTAPPRQIWRHPIGRAWSSFAVVGNLAFTQEQRDKDECVVAYDAATGNQKWVHRDLTILSIVEANGGPGPHATPEFDDGLIYSLGGRRIFWKMPATKRIR